MSIRFKAAAVALGLVVAAGSFGAASAETVIVKHRVIGARTVVVTHPHRIAPRVVTRVGVRHPAFVRLAPHHRIGAPHVVIR